MYRGGTRGGELQEFTCPAGSQVVRRSDRFAPGGGFLPDRLVVPFGGTAVPIPAIPPGLLPLLTESGRYGLTLVGEPEPDERLTGSACTACGQDAVNWLVLDQPATQRKAEPHRRAPHLISTS
jgi:hypothetical protein